MSHFIILSNVLYLQLFPERKSTHYQRRYFNEQSNSSFQRLEKAFCRHVACTVHRHERYYRRCFVSAALHHPAGRERRIRTGPLGRYPHGSNLLLRGHLKSLLGHAGRPQGTQADGRTGAAGIRLYHDADGPRDQCLAAAPAARLPGTLRRLHGIGYGTRHQSDPEGENPFRRRHVPDRPDCRRRGRSDARRHRR